VPMFEAPRLTAMHHMHFIDGLKSGAHVGDGLESHDIESRQPLA